MILAILFIALNAIYIAALLWCILAIRSTTKIGAEVLDIHTNALRRQDAEISALRERSFPRYADAVITLPVAEESPEVRDMAWGAHDAAVADAIANRLPGRATESKLSQNATYGRVGVWQTQPMDVVSAYPPELLRDDKSRGGVGLPDPESAPFFTQSQPEK